MKHIICVVDIHTSRRTVEIDTTCPKCHADLTQVASMHVSTLRPGTSAAHLEPATDNGFAHDDSLGADFGNPDIDGNNYDCARCGHVLATGAWVAEHA